MSESLRSWLWSPLGSLNWVPGGSGNCALAWNSSLQCAMRCLRQKLGSRKTRRHRDIGYEAKRNTINNRNWPVVCRKKCLDVHMQFWENKRFKRYPFNGFPLFPKQNLCASSLGLWHTPVDPPGLLVHYSWLRNSAPSAQSQWSIFSCRAFLNSVKQILYSFLLVLATKSKAYQANTLPVSIIHPWPYLPFYMSSLYVSSETTLA